MLFWVGAVAGPLWMTAAVLVAPLMMMTNRQRERLQELLTHRISRLRDVFFHLRCLDEARLSGIGMNQVMRRAGVGHLSFLFCLHSWTTSSTSSNNADKV